MKIRRKACESGWYTCDMSSGLRRGDGTKIRRKVCESGWYTCDSIWKVPTIGHLGRTSLVTLVCRDPRDARWLELSICYHMCTSHFRTPSFLSSYHHHFLILGSL